MATDAYQILCTGDVHLGRRPSRVPTGDDALSVRRVWDRFVDTALNRDVDACALTGDVVDSENQMYEAFGALERGIRRLVDGGVEVMAVAGNHDHSAFPRLIRSIDADGVHLLGQGGTWEEVALERKEGHPPVRVVGWSFPEAHVHASPLDGLNQSDKEGPCIGLLHCQAGSVDGQYAPVRRDALAQAPVDAWLLGHIHAPDVHREAGQLQLYPGSLQPLDPGETGVHGAWLVDIGPTEITAEQVPLASLRYETVTIDVTAIETGEDLETHVLQTVRENLAERTEEWPELAHVAYRLAFEGRTQLHREIKERGALMRGALRPEVDGTTATLEHVELRTRPAHDLEALARGDDPPGVLAQLLLKLENGDATDAQVQTVLRRASTATAKVHESSRYEPLRRDAETRDPPDRDALRTMLYEQGLLLLDELQAGRT